VGARQHTDPDADGTNGLAVAPIDPRLAREDTPAHGLPLQLAQRRRHLLGGPRRRIALAEGLHHIGAQRVQPPIAVHLLRDAVGFPQRRTRPAFHGLHQCVGVSGRRLPTPGLGGDLRGELPDQPDHLLGLLVPEHHGVQHDRFGQFVRLGLDHQHRAVGARHDQVQLGGLELAERRIEQELPVLVSDPGRAEGAVERNSGQRDRRGGPDHGRDLRIDLGLEGHHRRDDLDLVREPLGEQRPHRPVNQAGGEDLLFARPPLTTEEAAGDPPRGVGALLVVDRERQEVPFRRRLLGADHRDEHRGIPQRGHDGTTGLSGDLAGLERECA